MAFLVNTNFDIFAIPNAQGKVDHVHVPHHLTSLIRDIAYQDKLLKTADNLLDIHHCGLKVKVIKFVRVSIKDENGDSIGLKDAKDIVDHYYNEVNKV